MTHICVTSPRWVLKACSYLADELGHHYPGTLPSIVIHCNSIGKSPVRIILRCPTTIMVIKACFLIQPLEQEGGCQKCCISLCSKVFINHFYQMKASPECLNILIYWSKCWVERLRRTLRRKVKTGILYQQIYRLCHCIVHKVAHIDCSAPSGKQHEPQTGVWVIGDEIYEDLIFKSVAMTH